VNVYKIIIPIIGQKNDLPTTAIINTGFVFNPKVSVFLLSPLNLVIWLSIKKTNTKLNK